jgi:hypothetical protein
LHLDNQVGTINSILEENLQKKLLLSISVQTNTLLLYLIKIVIFHMQLESNIRGIAFSASWLKLIDDWPVESPSVSTGASAYQKRGAGGRRGRKRLLASEHGTATDDDNSWTWWSRGNISKRILQRGALLGSTLRKAARQGIAYFYSCFKYYFILYENRGFDMFFFILGGKKGIAGISYHEGSNLPRRTRQFAWRACVGLSQNSSQLAFQVSTFLS